MKRFKKILAVGVLCVSLSLPNPAKADLFGGDGVPRNARV